MWGLVQELKNIKLLNDAVFELSTVTSSLTIVDVELENAIGKSLDDVASQTKLFSLLLSIF